MFNRILLVFLFFVALPAYAENIFPKVEFLDNEVWIEHFPGQNPFAIIHVDNQCTGGMWQKSVDTEYGSVRVKWQSLMSCADGPDQGVLPDILSVIEVPNLVTALPDRVETWEDGNVDKIELWYFQGM